MDTIHSIWECYISNHGSDWFELKKENTYCRSIIRKTSLGRSIEFDIFSLHLCYYEDTRIIDSNYGLNRNQRLHSLGRNLSKFFPSNILSLFKPCFSLLVYFDCLFTGPFPSSLVFYCPRLSKLYLSIDDPSYLPLTF